MSKDRHLSNPSASLVCCKGCGKDTRRRDSYCDDCVRHGPPDSRKPIKFELIPAPEPVRVEGEEDEDAANSLG